jgi:DNA-binding transcriptional MerR regulator
MYLGIGEVARRLGCMPWQIRKVIAKGLLPPPPRFGPHRVFVPADLPEVERALKAAGYLRESKPEEAVTSAS